jgi:hypothetical protein
MLGVGVRKERTAAPDCVVEWLSLMDDPGCLRARLGSGSQTGCRSRDGSRRKIGSEDSSRG